MSSRLSTGAACAVGLGLDDIRTRLGGVLVRKFNGRDSAFDLLTVVGCREQLHSLVCDWLVFCDERESSLCALRVTMSDRGLRAIEEFAGEIGSEGDTS